MKNVVQAMKNRFGSLLNRTEHSVNGKFFGPLVNRTEQTVKAGFRSLVNRTASLLNGTLEVGASTQGHFVDALNGGAGVSKHDRPSETNSRWVLAVLALSTAAVAFVARTMYSADYGPHSSLALGASSVKLIRDRSESGIAYRVMDSMEMREPSSGAGAVTGSSTGRSGGNAGKRSGRGRGEVDMSLPRRKTTEEEDDFYAL